MEDPCSGFVIFIKVDIEHLVMRVIAGKERIHIPTHSNCGVEVLHLNTGAGVNIPNKVWWVGHILAGKWILRDFGYSNQHPNEKQDDEDYDDAKKVY